MENPEKQFEVPPLTPEELELATRILQNNPAEARALIERLGGAGSATLPEVIPQLKVESKTENVAADPAHIPDELGGFEKDADSAMDNGFAELLNTRLAEGNEHALAFAEKTREFVDIVNKAEKEGLQKIDFRAFRFESEIEKPAEAIPGVNPKEIAEIIASASKEFYNIVYGRDLPDGVDQPNIEIVDSELIARNKFQNYLDSHGLSILQVFLALEGDRFDSTSMLARNEGRRTVKNAYSWIVKYGGDMTLKYADVETVG